MAHLGECKWTHVFPFLVVGIYVLIGISNAWGPFPAGAI